MVELVNTESILVVVVMLVGSITTEFNLIASTLVTSGKLV